MARVRLGAVEYLNARPLVFGLAESSAFDLRLDTPARCADLLHANEIDLGLIPSIEYLRAPETMQYRIVPGIAIGSKGPVASVALYTTRALPDVRSIALDTTSRTSAALTRVLCTHVFGIEPRLEHHAPDLTAMLARYDAALIIGDKALFLDGGSVMVEGRPAAYEKIDLGQAWTSRTGLPFVYAFWAGRSHAVSAEQVTELMRARDQAVLVPERVAAEYFRAEPQHVAVGAAYLRDNIQYALGPDERAGLDLFYRYAAEAGVVRSSVPLQFF